MNKFPELDQNPKMERSTKMDQFPKLDQEWIILRNKNEQNSKKLASKQDNF